MRCIIRSLLWLSCALVATSTARAQGIIADGGFDGQGGGVSQSCTTAACPSGVWSLDGAAGFVRDGNADWTPPPSVSHYHMLWLQGSWGRATQSFTVPASGNYIVSFWVASRDDHGWFAGNQIVFVKVAGQQVTRLPLSSGMPFRRYLSAAIQLSTGTSYQLELIGSNQGDNTAFFDDITVVPASSTTAYQYDALGRLTAVNIIGGADAGQSHAYAHDPAGNRTHVTITGAP